MVENFTGSLYCMDTGEDTHMQMNPALLQKKVLVLAVQSYINFIFLFFVVG